MRTLLIIISLILAHSMDTHAQDSHALVTFFSATGTTEAVAKKIAKAANADYWQIQPAQPYSAEDLDWTDKQSRSSVEMNDPDSRPALRATCPNIADYDTIFIGYPIWWYVAPTIINTFIEAHELDGKTLIPFATSGSSPIGPTVEALREQYPHLDFLDGRLLNRASDAAIRTWVEGL